MAGILDILQALGGAPNLSDKRLMGTPGINPNAPDPRLQLPSLQAPQGGGSLLSPLLSKLGPIGRGADSFLGEIGGAARNAASSGALAALAPRTTAGVMRGDENRRENGLAGLRKRLLELQIESASRPSPLDGFGRINPSDFTPESLAQFQKSRDFADLEFRDRNSASTATIEEFRFLQGLSPEDRETFFRIKRGSPFEDIPGIGVVQPSPSGGEPTVIADEETVSSGRAGRGAAETLAKRDVDAVRKLPLSIQQKDEQIKRIDGFIEALRDGRLDTGFFQQNISRFTPLGQDFQAFSGEEVVRLIGEATFGALSEGERKFLSDVTFSLAKDEDINVQDLKRMRRILVNAKEIEENDLARLQQRDSERFSGFSIAE